MFAIGVERAAYCNLYVVTYLVYELDSDRGGLILQLRSCSKYLELLNIKGNKIIYQEFMYYFVLRYPKFVEYSSFLSHYFLFRRKFLSKFEFL